MSNAKPKELWAAIKSSVGSKTNGFTVANPLLTDVDAVNTFFADISFYNGTNDCSIPSVNFTPDDDNDVFIREYELEPLLQRRIKPPAPGLDALPSWLLASAHMN